MASKTKPRKPATRLLLLKQAKAPRLTEALAREAIALRASSDLTVAAIAGKVGLTAQQLYTALGEYPDFGKAFADAGEERRQEIVAAAKASMLRRIKGYSYTEQKKKFVRKRIGNGDDDTELVCVENVTVNRHVEPSDRMIEFALENYAPNEFNARKSPGIEPDGAGDTDTVTAEEARRIADEILR
ncbi:MAG: hypothetical protein NC048_09965 [Bacteroides sp.]|nr:hypothetical protein [Bacteroides sp.]